MLERNPLYCVGLSSIPAAVGAHYFTTMDITITVISTILPRSSQVMASQPPPPRLLESWEGWRLLHASLD